MGKEFIMKTNPEAIDFLDYQFHDFSMRGMGGKSAIVNSGLGFCNRIKSSDTLPVIPAARMYYDEVEPCINSNRIRTCYYVFTNWLLYAKCKVVG
jgi:hypothetical protein